MLGAAGDQVPGDRDAARFGALIRTQPGFKLRLGVGFGSLHQDSAVPGGHFQVASLSLSEAGLEPVTSGLRTNFKAAQWGTWRMWRVESTTQ